MVYFKWFYLQIHIHNNNINKDHHLNTNLKYRVQFIIIYQVCYHMEIKILDTYKFIFMKMVYKED